MSAEYVSDAAETSRRKPGANADNLKAVKNREYGDDIENRIHGRSLLANQSSKEFFRHWIEPGCNF